MIALPPPRFFLTTTRYTHSLLPCLFFTLISLVFCHSQEIDGEEREQRQLMIANCHNNLISSDTDDGWSDGDAGKIRQGQDLSGFCKSHSASKDQQKRPLHKRFSCPRDINTIARCLKSSNIGHIPDCTQWIDLRLSTGENETTDTQIQSQLQHMQPKHI
ncbi:PRSS12 [Acanthosepion pharaonis]|uniref:PRSS12 n=1 Tax=Acanthosepion pharaonis TaxID=158019 RepID=A0A812BQ84_ACAPH|nr:PRSS12 [Sepia pharaonis]